MRGVRHSGLTKSSLVDEWVLSFPVAEEADVFDVDDEALLLVVRLRLVVFFDDECVDKVDSLERVDLLSLRRRARRFRCDCSSVSSMECSLPTCLAGGSHRNRFYLHLRPLGKRGHLHRRPRRRCIGKIFPVDGVHRRKIVDISQEYRCFGHFLQ